MAIDKKTFLKNIVVIYDTREQKNQHILDKLSEMKVPIERRKLDFGDYSFVVEGRDFSLNCVIERKASVDELFSNVTVDRERLEKEFRAAYHLANEFVLLVEGVSSWEELKNYKLSNLEMTISSQRKVKEIGSIVYPTLKAWYKANRYRFSVEFSPDRQLTAAKILEIFYYYWRNYKELTAERKI